MEDRRDLRNLLAESQRLFSKDEKGYDRHSSHVHHTQREEDYEEEPAAAETVEAVFKSHAKRAPVALAPCLSGESW